MLYLRCILKEWPITFTVCWPWDCELLSSFYSSLFTVEKRGPEITKG